MGCQARSGQRHRPRADQPTRDDAYNKRHRHRHRRHDDLLADQLLRSSVETLRQWYIDRSPTGVIDGISIGPVSAKHGPFRVSRAVKMKVDSLDLSSQETKTEIETLTPCMVCIFNCKRVQMRMHRKKSPRIVIFFQVLHHLRFNNAVAPQCLIFSRRPRSLTLTRRRAQYAGWLAGLLDGWLA